MDYNTNQPLPQPDKNVIDLREYLRIVAKWKKFIISGTLMFIMAAAILSFFVMSPVYQAKTLLMVTQATNQLQSTQNQQQEGLEDVVGNLSRLPVLTMNTYLGQLKSDILMQRVIDDLKLDPELYSAGGLSNTISGTIVKDSNLIEVKVQNTDPSLAAAIANNLNKQFLNLISEKNAEQMSRSVTFLKEQRDSTDLELQKATEALKKFQEQPQGVSVLEQEFAKKAETISELESQMELASVELNQLQAGIVQLEKNLKATTPTTRVEKVEPSTGRTYTVQESNPLYVSSTEKLNDKRAALAEKQAETTGLMNLLQNSRLELNDMQAELAGKKLYQDKLQREVDRLKTTSETLAQKTTETQISKSINFGDTSVIVVSEAAIPGSPIKPNKVLNMAIAMLLGFMAFTVLAFLLESLDNTLKNPEDITNHLDLTVMGVIPFFDKRSSNSTNGG